jgi:hypothetical protein
MAARLVECGSLKMIIDRSAGAEKSQRLINSLFAEKRNNPSITTSELNYIAIGFKEANRG